MIKIIARCGPTSGAQAAEGAPRRVCVSQESSSHHFSVQRLPRHKSGKNLLQGTKGKVAAAIKFRKNGRKEISNENRSRCFSIHTSFDLRTS